MILSEQEIAEIQERFKVTTYRYPVQDVLDTCQALWKVARAAELVRTNPNPANLYAMSEAILALKSESPCNHHIPLNKATCPECGIRTMPESENPK